MKYIIFTRESNDFQDILTDPNLKKHIMVKMTWKNHLKMGIPIAEEKLVSYIELKYGDDIINRVCRDFSPVPGVDYSPQQPEVCTNSTEPQS